MKNINKIEENNAKTWAGVVPGYDALLLARMAKEHPAIVHVTSDEKRLYTLADQLKFFAPSLNIIEFPGWDCLPYDRVSPNPDITSARVKALSKLSAQDVDQPFIVLTTISALLQRLSPKEMFAQNSLVLKTGNRHEMEDITAFLQQNAYTRADTVREIGEYAVRGGILDVFPAGSENPVRLDFFGDELESIKVFDPLTQLTENAQDSVHFIPAHEIILNEESATHFRHKYRQIFGPESTNDPIYEAIQAGQRYAGMEHWLPLFFDQMATLFDYLNQDYVLSFDAQIESATHDRLAQIEEYYEARQQIKESDTLTYRPLPPDALYLTEQNWEEISSGNLAAETIFMELHDMPGSIPQGSKYPKNFAAERLDPNVSVYNKVIAHFQQERQTRTCLVASYSDGARQRLMNLFKEHGLKSAVAIENWADAEKLKKDETGFICLNLEHGFVTDSCLILTETDILGDRLSKPIVRKKRAGEFIFEVSSLEENDLVVHEEHGIARYEGLETLEVSGLRHDCLKLVYAGGDRLFLPVEHLDMLSKFGSEDSAAQLDKLGGAAWQARKAKVKKDLLAIADDLIKTAAERTLKSAEVMKPTEGSFNEFCARFPYAETADQLNAIEESLNDLAKGRPMDRLVCGDVGFGKTEIALRAAFVAAMEGYQVAVVVPTTLLARQHTANFEKRFERFPIKIAQLSRLISPTQAKRTKDEIAKGTVDIVIGTHALLAESIQFKNMGLLIVDEEQRFGVKQKEKLKALKTNVHVLTLTATPIPRTLQLSLTGVKDLSLIASPPVDRIAVRTFTMPFDSLIIREAIMREKHRGGQVFYVCPRIKDLKDVAEKLETLVPECKFAVAHGQMKPDQLEDVMSAFLDGKYDILLSTNIVESGLDIPTANTMVVHHADRFGLAQLYQLRGRIGRSKTRAYCYLTLEPRKMPTKNALKRLEVMATLDHLGAGFSLASHDMDIRGAGNLLGEEQSGHIKEIGVELYQQMLEEAIAAKKAGHDELAMEKTDIWSPQINLGTSVLIPEAYVADLNVRLSLYRRIAKLESREEIDAFAAEMIDRFGSIPDELESLFHVVALKPICRKAYIEKVEAGPKGATLTFYNNFFPNPEKLISFIQAQSGTMKIKPDQRIVIQRPWQDIEKRIKGLTDILSEIATLTD